jgi:hypothetical protein
MLFKVLNFNSRLMYLISLYFIIHNEEIYQELKLTVGKTFLTCLL